MHKKTKVKLQAEEPKFVIPSHMQIEEDLKRALDFRNKMGHGGPYPLPVLDFIIGEIGCQIELAYDAEEFKKDDEFYNSGACTNGITNGEFYYSLYKTILKLTEQEGFNFSGLSLCDHQVFALILDLAIGSFMELHLEGGLDQMAVDLWILFTWCRKVNNRPIWENENFEPADPPQLDKLKRDDWEMMAEEIKNHFFEDDEFEWMEMALLDDQPHWPTFQEFRKAKAWLTSWYSDIRQNRVVGR